ncbi:MAG: hypothetical protein HQL88_07400 [Magnetococcales bacterium]|nr:hypothetical protein [Magnetococcales bacterium]
MAEETGEERVKSPPESPGKKKCPVCKKGVPLWFISWADMTTLLLCLFVIIVAFSTQEKGKYLTLAGSMRDAFGSKNPDESMPPIARGYHLVNMQFQKKITLVQIAEQARGVLSALIDQGRAVVSDDELGVFIQVDRDALFAADGPALSEAVQTKLTELATIITLLPNTVEIRVSRFETPGKPFAWDVGVAEGAAIAAVFEQQGGVLYDRVQVTSLALMREEQVAPGSKPQKENIEIRIMKTTSPEE